MDHRDERKEGLVGGRERSDTERPGRREGGPGRERGEGRGAGEGGGGQKEYRQKVADRFDRIGAAPRQA